ncbi:kinase-like domain-containing protein [Rhizophagus irregularis DAOM 181602=DAOM 197198]|nr:kinase-like domain-containing protein [Rhizophagus irregularis DAOM 181602=DAOM 197198]
MNLVNDDSFDPTPKLKSSLIPIKFFSFNTADENCVYCEEEYSRKLFCPWKKYCKKCYVSHYDSTNIMMCVHCKKSSQGTCGNCVKTLNFMHRKYSHYCNLCIKPFQTKDNFVLCSNCYLISFEWIESTLFKKQILILYLPWWHDNSNCDLCHSELTFTSDCQKYCGNCPMFYTGCRYCLTTNIIFGLTGQTTCKKCKRISLIIDRNVFDDFFLDDISYGNIDNLNLEIANIIKSIDRVFEPLTLLYSIFKKIKIAIPVRSIPYSEFKDVKEITKGGYEGLEYIHKNTFWSYKYVAEFEQAEVKRNRLIESKMIGPEFAEKCHPEAIYTSRPLSDIISKCSSINSSSAISFCDKQDYNYNYISKEKELDIDVESLSSQDITIQNSSTSLKKRNNEELNSETQDNSNSGGKRVKLLNDIQ